MARHVTPRQVAYDMASAQARKYVAWKASQKAGTKKVPRANGPKVGGGGRYYKRDSRGRFSR